MCTCGCKSACKYTKTNAVKLLPKHAYVVVCNVGFIHRTNTEVVADEGGKPVFLTVSRSNGLESSVSVEWETQPDTAVASG